ncbi:MAG: vitamin B12-dependent ribonucleotide reductase [Mycoplasma sp.]|nr:vitamin B12-dependent ribonucleotide reductase [Mycoplasma sp.]
MKYSKNHIEQLNRQIKEHFPLIAPITEKMKTSRTGVSRMVMLDRYANKDVNLKTLEVNDLVIAKIKDDPKFPTSGIGYVTKISGKKITIEVEESYVPSIDPALKPKNNQITVNKNSVSKPLELYYEQIVCRVSKNLAQVESQNEKEKWTKEFYNILANEHLIPAGRVLYGAGSGTNVTYFNCFVLPMIQDSREGIAKHRWEAMEIMSRGGGVGTNGSTLRPKNEIAKKVGGKSSGVVSWLNDLSSLTNLIQQGGSRRGAQMIMLNDWHPDIIEFIISKMQNPNILKWIIDNFKNPRILAEAKRKLKFVPLTESEIRIHKEIIKLSKDEELVKNSKQKIKGKGTYEVENIDFLSGANISVGITKEFMEAVENDDDYDFIFPDVNVLNPAQKKFYNEKWHQIGDVREWKKMGYPVKKYGTIKAQELWDLINFCATYSAEPGIFFIDVANEMTNASSYNQKVVCTNPCGEQPLTPYSVCNLAALNLDTFINKETKEILWDDLKKTVRVAVRLQDNIINSTPYFLEANEKQALGERRIGLGIMGLHDLLIWKGLRYGSPKSLKLIDKVFETIATEAYIYSSELGKEKGHFLFQQSIEKLLETGYIKKLNSKAKNAIKKNGGLRNSHLLTIAPTGSTGTMMGVSTGLEPYFAFKYYRSGRLGKFIEVDQPIVKKWKEINNYTKDELPEFFATSMDITPDEHVDVQTTIQRWIDSSISKTVNAPKGFSVKNVERVYMKLYKNGAKGGTVYVDGSRDAQVLSISKDENDVKKVVDVPISHEFIERKHEIEEKLVDVPSLKQGKKFGNDIGDICPICKEGIVEDIGGCSTCTNCQAQLKCGL